AWFSDQSESGFFASIRQLTGTETRTLPVQPLRDDDSEALIKALLPGAVTEAIEWVRRGSRDLPFLIHELAAYMARAPGQLSEISAEMAIVWRADTLEPRARSVLRVVAVADGPLPEEVIRSAANVSTGYYSARDRLIDLRM